MTAERDQLASQVSSLGAHVPARACGTGTLVDETIGRADELVSRYQELVAVVDAENAGLRAENEGLRVALAEAEARAERFRDERKLHEKNAEMALRAVDAHAQHIEALEAELVLERSRRIYEGYLRDVRNGASFRETGARYYGMRRVGFFR
jgi:regulator of replication initiation timing